MSSDFKIPYNLVQGEIKNAEKVIKTKSNYEYGNPQRQKPRKDKNAGQSRKTDKAGNNFKQPVQYSFFFIFYIACPGYLKIIFFIHLTYLFYQTIN